MPLLITPFLPHSPEKPTTRTRPIGEPTNLAAPRIQLGLYVLRSFLKISRASGARVRVLQFADRQEAPTGAPQPGHHWIAQALQQEVASVEVGPFFRGCGPIASLYIDGIQLYAATGQVCLAQAS